MTKNETTVKCRCRFSVANWRKLLEKSLCNPGTSPAVFFSSTQVYGIKGQKLISSVGCLGAFLEMKKPGNMEKTSAYKHQEELGMDG